jgi:adenosylcobinamide amidohydrolase
MGAAADSELLTRTEDGVECAALVWRFARPLRSASTAACGGGIGPRHWVINAQVPDGYARTDLASHVAELARLAGLTGGGVGMLTAVDVRAVRVATDAGVRVAATVGLTHPRWAADLAGAELVGGAASAGRPGTINVVALLPVRLEDGALVNAVATVTEAKCQALRDAGIEGTGTPSDAVTVLCPATGPPAPFGGPRSEWGGPLARAAYWAVRGGRPGPAP